MAYSLDLRERVVATVKEGAKQPEVAERFKVSLSSVERYLRLDREGELRAKPPPGRPASISTEAYGALAVQVTEHNDARHCHINLPTQSLNQADGVQTTSISSYYSLFSHFTPG